MDAINLYLFPPILKMTQWSSLSAEGKTCLNSAKLLNSVFCTILNQRCNAILLSGCFSQNWMSVLRVMMCTGCFISQFEIFDKGWVIDFSMNSLILPTTTDRFLITSSFPKRILIPRIIVPTRKLIVDFIRNAIVFAAFADPFIFNARILE